MSAPFLFRSPALRAAFVAATLTALGCQSSFAQFGGGSGGGGRHGRGSSNTQSQSPRSDSSSPTTLASQVRDRLYDLRLRLMITPEQSALWDRFSDKVWDLAVHPARAAAFSEMPNVMSAVQQQATTAQSRAAQWQAISDALGPLYASFTQEQQQLADQQLPSLLGGS